MTIARGGAVSELVASPMPDIADIVATTDLGTMSLAEAMADPRSRMQAIAVLHKGEIVFERYPGMPSEMKHSWNSSSKTITGLMIHILEEDGLIDLKAPASSYLAFTKGSPIGAITVEDVLHHRSGLDFEESQANFQNPDHPLGKFLASAMTARGEPVGPAATELVVDVEATKPPNTAYEYSTFNTQILGFIVEEVTGKPWNIAVSERIWSKSGMEGEALLALSAAGEGLSGAVFASTLRDFARFAILFTPSWNAVADERIVSETFFEKTYAAMNRDIYQEGYLGPRLIQGFGEEGSPVAGAYQWDAIFEDGDLYKGGLGGQAIYVSPETDTAVVYFSTTWQNSLSLTAYARAIVNQKFRQK